MLGSGSEGLGIEGLSCIFLRVKGPRAGRLRHNSDPGQFMFW